MKYKHVILSDAATGLITVAGSKKKYFKTKDSTSPSGHSLITQIDMTHAGIVTRNYGFYLPAKMRKGAGSFTQDYFKPVLIGHDEEKDSKPVGRVVQADYIDTVNEYIANDKYLRRIYGWMDKEESKKDATIDFVNYVISNYDAKKGYKGLGHIKGTLRITDEETITSVLDETYLTVSTSMISDAARCSVCGTDWVAEGMCEHHRGQVYDDQVCVLIPGNMRYDHVGIVNSPADPHAHTFVIIDSSGSVVKQDSIEDQYKVNDSFDIAANLFAYKDNSLVSLSSKEDINLIDVKDNIQKMENAMKKKVNTQDPSLLQRISDSMSISVRVFRYNEEGKDDMDVSVSQYTKELEEKSLQKLVSRVSEMLSDSEEVTDEIINNKIGEVTDSLFNNIIQDKEEDKSFVEAWEKIVKVEDNTVDNTEDDNGNDNTVEDIIISTLIKDEEEDKETVISDSIKKVYSDELSKKQNNAIVQAVLKKIERDSVAELNYNTDSLKELVEGYLKLQDAKSLGDMTVEEIYEAMSEALGEKALSGEELGNLKSSDFCGKKGAFPVVDKEHYLAAKKVLSEVKASDSVKKRILDSIEKKAEKLGLDKEVFDTQVDPCHNDDASKEELIKAFEDAKKNLEENGIEIPGNNESNEEITEKEQEISILEAQLDAANEELEEAKEELGEYKIKLVDSLAITAVDKKIAQGFQIEDKEKEIEEHKKRSLDSLNDLIADLEKNDTKETKINDGVANDPAGSVDDPTLQNNNDETTSKRSEQEKNDKERYKIYDQYQQKLTRYGKKIADQWLALIQRKKGLRPTID